MGPTLMTFTDQVELREKDSLRTSIETENQLSCSGCTFLQVIK